MLWNAGSTFGERLYSSVTYSNFAFFNWGKNRVTLSSSSSKITQHNSPPLSSHKCEVWISVPDSLLHLGVTVITSKSIFFPSEMLTPFPPPLQSFDCFPISFPWAPGVVLFYYFLSNDCRKGICFLLDTVNTLPFLLYILAKVSAKGVISHTHSLMVKLKLPSLMGGGKETNHMSRNHF